MQAGFTNHEIVEGFKEIETYCDFKLTRKMSILPDMIKEAMADAGDREKEHKLFKVGSIAFCKLISPGFYVEILDVLDDQYNTIPDPPESTTDPIFYKVKDLTGIPRELQVSPGHLYKCVSPLLFERGDILKCINRTSGFNLGDKGIIVEVPDNLYPNSDIKVMQQGGMIYTVSLFYWLIEWRGPLVEIDDYVLIKQTGETAQVIHNTYWEIGKYEVNISYNSTAIVKTAELFFTEFSTIEPYKPAYQLGELVTIEFRGKSGIIIEVPKVKGDPYKIKIVPDDQVKELIKSQMNPKKFIDDLRKGKV